MLRNYYFEFISCHITVVITSISIAAQFEIVQTPTESIYILGLLQGVILLRSSAEFDAAVIYCSSTIQNSDWKVAKVVIKLSVQ